MSIVVKTWEKEGEVTTGSGGIRTTYREDWGHDEVGGDGGEPAGDTTGRKVVVQYVYGAHGG